MSCSGRCLTGADIGMPEYGGSWYAIDPDCPEHGEPMTREEEEMVPPDVEPGPCPCGDFDPEDGGWTDNELCVCGHQYGDHTPSPDGTSRWCGR